MVANADVGILVDTNSAGITKGVNGLIVEDDTITDNGLDNQSIYPANAGGNQDGVLVNEGNGGVQFINDQVFQNNNAGLYLAGGSYGAGASTVQGGAYYEQTGLYGDNGVGIDDDQGSQIEDALVYANNSDGIYTDNDAGYSGTPPGTVTGNSVYGNDLAGIDANTALVSDNLVYSQISTTRSAIELNDATGTGNTIYGSSTGIFAGSDSAAEDNLVYDNRSTGIFYTLSPPAAISGNTIYGNAIGITGAEYYTGPTILISGNLIYANTTAGIALTGGAYQSIINNTIDQPTGTDISIVGSTGAYSATTDDTTIENNILVAASGPAISVAPSAETGFESNYNLFDVGSTTNETLNTPGTIGVWEGVSYTNLATWYYELGLDQFSQVGNPDFVAPTGPDGILGVGGATDSPQFNSVAYTANAATLGAPFDGPVQQLTSIGAVPAGTLQLSGTWTPNYTTGSFFNAVPSVVTSGASTITTTEEYYFPAGDYAAPLTAPVIPIVNYRVSGGEFGRHGNLDLHRPEPWRDLPGGRHRTGRGRSRHGGIRGDGRQRERADGRQRQPG